MSSGQQKHAVIPDEVERASWPVDGQAVANNIREEAQLPSVGERAETAEPPCRTCVHLQVAPRISSSIFFLDKSLLISLEGLCGGGGRRGGGEVENRTSYRSTLSVRLGASPRSRCPASVETKKDERCRARSGWVPRRDLEGPEVKISAPARGVHGGFGHSEKGRRRPLGSRPLSRPSPSQERREDTALCGATPRRSESDKPGSRRVHRSSRMQIPLRPNCLCYAQHARDTSTFAAVYSGERGGVKSLKRSTVSTAF